MKVLRRRANQKVLTKASTQTKKNAINEIDHEEILVTYNPVINGPIYFNLFECDKIS